jgi:CheY-like chemotaxis protein
MRPALFGNALEILRLAQDDDATSAQARETIERQFRQLVRLIEMHGYEVAQRIREQPELREVVLAAITGWGQEEDRRRAREAGFDHHVTKPLNRAALERLLTALK